MSTVNVNSSQSFVPIKEVRDGIVILKDGAMRLVLMGSSLNFALKSTDEQNGIISQFQNFLNSLDFSVQILVQSKKLDIRPYLALLEERYKEQTSELMKIQVREYVEFIKAFTEQTSIMSKSFFIIVPYTPPALGEGGSSILKMFPHSNKDDASAKIDIFEENRSQLEQRANVVVQGLTRSGLKVAQLGTEEVVELFYKIFNPGETEKPIQL